MIRWWRANWGRLVGSLIGGALVLAAMLLAWAAVVGAGRLAIWAAGF